MSEFEKEVKLVRQNSIAFDNLRAEMARKNICIQDIAKICGYNRDTLARKLSKKSPINLDEAFDIQSKVFPDMDVRYLFDSSRQDIA